MRKQLVTLVSTATLALTVLGAAPAAADPPPRDISVDSITNSSSQHATQVEPDTFAFGQTVVAAFQNGRNFAGSSAAIGVSVSHNGGHTWRSRTYLPWLTVFASPSGPFVAATDPSVAYDALHHRWLISTLVTGGGMTGGGLAISASDDNGDKPLVQPDGTVVVPVDNLVETALLAYRSTDGGASWGPTIGITPIQRHVVAGNLRAGALPSAEIDATGTVFVAWPDCRFRPGCSSNDILISRSTDGITWTAPARVPIDAVGSTVDHFIPGLAVDPSTSGSRAHLGLAYYSYPQADCTPATCRLNIGFISSTNAGTTWSAPRRLNQTSMELPWLADTSQGRMVGDYISTSFSNGKAVPVFALASAPDPAFRESMFSAVVNV